MALLFKKKHPAAKINVNRPEQLRSDSLAMTAQFASHPFISVSETSGTPPDKYILVYKLDGLHQTGKSIESKQEHSIEISLPPAYPLEMPLCKSLSPVYHPNFSQDSIDINGFWKKSPSLVALVVHIGNMIVFNEYDTENPINAEAAKWAMRNKNILPLSPTTIELKIIWPDLPKEQQPMEPTSEIKLEIPNQDIHGSDTKAVDQELISSQKQVMENIVILDTNTDESSQVSPDLAISGSNTKENKSLHVTLPDETVTPSVALPPKRPQKKNSHQTADTIVIIESPVVHDEKRIFQPVEKAMLDAPVIPKIISETEHTQKKSPSQMVLFKFLYCPYCGSKNNKDANFCMNCGSRLKTVKRKNLRQILSIIAMITVPLTILLGGFTAVILHAINHKDLNASSKPFKSLADGRKTDSLTSPKMSGTMPQTTPSTIEQKMLQKAKVQSKPIIFSSPKSMTEEEKTKKIAELLQNARLYMNIGSYDDAIKRYNEVLKISPTNFEASMGIDSAQEAREKAPTHSSFE